VNPYRAPLSFFPSAFPSHPLKISFKFAPLQLPLFAKPGLACSHRVHRPYFEQWVTSIHYMPLILQQIDRAIWPCPCSI
jgi:hypothetical protein